MIIVGLTGGICTGKSTVSAYIKKNNQSKYGNNVFIIDADVISKEIVEYGKPAYKDIIKYFNDKVEGKSLEIVDQNGNKCIDRTKLGKFVFAPENKEHLQKLNSFTHPRVIKEIIKQILHAHIKGYKVCILDVPLLLENDLLKNLCYKICSTIMSDKDKQLERLVKRNPDIPKEQLSNRIQAQKLTNEQRELMSDYLINNDNDDISLLYRQVDYLMEKELLTMSDGLHLIEWLFPPFGFLSGLNIFLRNYYFSKNREHTVQEKGIYLNSLLN